MKISVVSYLNSKPFLYGLQHKPSPEWEISLDIPSECARKVATQEADIGLIPVAALKSIPGCRVVSPYCIGANGRVDSVKLYSEEPLDRIKKIMLDYQSRTSVALVKIIAKELWKISPEWESADEGYERKISGSTAGVVIGDRTFNLNGKFVHEYDLSEAWYQLTRLPFVFAVWASRKEISAEAEERFSSALEYGISHMPEVVQFNQPYYPETDIKKYLVESIQYKLTPEMRKGMDLFLHKLA